MLQNAYLLAKIGADTAENEQHFAENLPKIGNFPTGPPRRPPRRGSGPAEAADVLEHLEDLGGEAACGRFFFAGTGNCSGRELRRSVA